MGKTKHGGSGRSRNKVKPKKRRKQAVAKPELQEETKQEEIAPNSNTDAQMCVEVIDRSREYLEQENERAQAQVSQLALQVTSMQTELNMLYVKLAAAQKKRKKAVRTQRDTVIERDVLKETNKELTKVINRKYQTHKELEVCHLCRLYLIMIVGH
jgi:predicted RNase H-like nuclease (RuvC/YqgF family)